MRNENKKEETLADYVFGKVPPNALPLEEAVMGAMLLQADAVHTLRDILEPSDFYVKAHETIVGVCFDMAEKGLPIDLVLVTQELMSRKLLDEVGGGYYLVEMTNRVGSAANMEFHAGIIKAMSVRRKVIEFGNKLVRMGYEEGETLDKLLEEMEKGISSTGGEQGTVGGKDMADYMGELLKAMEAASLGKDGLVGVPSGHTTIDRATGGWMSPRLIILAARPAMGKTALAINWAVRAAQMGYPVGVLSLEMDRTELMARIVSGETGIDSRKITRAMMQEHEWQQVHSAAERLSSLPLYIDDTPAITLAYARRVARFWIRKHRIRLLVIDYLQLMQDVEKSGNREQEISRISRGLKSMAKQLGIPVIALSQLSRAVETRGGSKRPQLSDLRESGAIEQDADIVVFIHRPEYYDIVEDEKGDSLKGIAEIIFAKHRGGPVGTERLRFDEKTVTFSDIETFSFEPPAVSSHSEYGYPVNEKNITPSKDDLDIPF